LKDSNGSNVISIRNLGKQNNIILKDPSNQKSNLKHNQQKLKQKRKIKPIKIKDPNHTN